jgi:hypothetical protein
MNRYICLKILAQVEKHIFDINLSFLFCLSYAYAYPHIYKLISFTLFRVGRSSYKQLLETYFLARFFGFIFSFFLFSDSSLLPLDCLPTALFPLLYTQWYNEKDSMFMNGWKKKAYSRDPLSSQHVSWRELHRSLYDWVAMRLFELTETRTYKLVLIQRTNLIFSSLFVLARLYAYYWGIEHNHQNFITRSFFLGKNEYSW